ncbi:hypothetical protein ACGFMO_33000 [Streptomyces niveus]|uniref:hypothetical protein n=1 Tax=Streptomyces niveus TaxID=193462 RepID=UPI00371100C0
MNSPRRGRKGARLRRSSSYRPHKRTVAKPQTQSPEAPPTATPTVPAAEQA